MSNNFRNYKIDFLRGLAILAVLILHFNISYHFDTSALNQIFSTNFINRVASNGNYGVTIFFVISGFLITSTSLERYGSLGKIDAFNFYIYRFARIMPCLILVLSLITLFQFLNIPIFQNNANSTSFTLAIFSVLTFWHNVLMEKVGYFNYCLNIFWSLSVEEMFYLAFPVLCLLVRNTRLIMLFFILTIIISPIYRSYYTNNEIIALYGYVSCFDAIAMGCLAAIIARKVKLHGWQRRILSYGAGSLMIGVYLYSNIMENVVIGVSLMAVGVALFLISASNDEVQSDANVTNLFSRFVCWFGKNSYELYLFHIIVLALMKEMMDPTILGNYTKLCWFTMFMCMSALVAGTISLLYSQPMNKYLRNIMIRFRQQELHLESQQSL